VAGWKIMVEEFEKDQEMPLDARTKPNPYELPKSGMFVSRMGIIIIEVTECMVY
jgi:hypothetical protein